MVSWQDRGRGGGTNLDGTSAGQGIEALPLGPGEWEDALGLPLCLVCQNVRDSGDLLSEEKAMLTVLTGREDGILGKDTGLEWIKLGSCDGVDGVV